MSDLTEYEESRYYDRESNSEKSDYDDYPSSEDDESCITQVSIGLEKEDENKIINFFIKYKCSTDAYNADLDEYTNERHLIEEIIQFRYFGWKIQYITTTKFLEESSRIDLELDED